MNTLKAFVNIKSLIENSNYNDSNVGELSSLGYTYARDKQIYNNTSSPANADYELITFTSTNNLGAFKELSQQDVAGILKIVHELRVVFNSFTGITKAAVLTYLYSVPNLNVTDIEYSGMVANSAINMPGWVGFIYNNTSVSLWFSDALFRSDYEEYTILVIPPTDLLDELTEAPHLVIDKLINADLPSFVSKITNTKGIYPETVLKIQQFEYVNPRNPTQKVKANWGYLIYGLSGDYLNTIKNVTIDYLRENSSKPLSYWESIFPEIFRRNEFILLPRWDQISIPDRLTSTGIYSQISKHGVLNMRPEDYLPGYTNQHIYSNIYLVPFSYRYMLINLVNGEHNQADVKDFRVLYPDYVPIAANSLDFNRMVPRTQQMIVALEGLIREADVHKDHTLLPNNIRKTYKGQVQFLSRQLGKVSFMVLPKKEFFK